MRKFDLSLRSSRSSYFATFRHQLTILSKTDALDEEKWLNMLGTFVKDCFFFNAPATTEIYTLSLHDALPISTRVQGGAGVPLNDMIALTVRATGGTYTLSYDVDHDGAIGAGETTAPLPFDATAEVVRKALQKVIAQGDLFQELKFDFTVDRYVTYDAAGPPAPAGVALVYLIGLQGNL